MISHAPINSTAVGGVSTNSILLKAVPLWAIAPWTGVGTGPDSPRDLVQCVLAMVTHPDRDQGMLAVT
ncbi:hypothetical protein FF2_008666 [Malus domestica]